VKIFFRLKNEMIKGKGKEKGKAKKTRGDRISRKISPASEIIFCVQTIVRIMSFILSYDF